MIKTKQNKNIKATYKYLDSLLLIIMMMILKYKHTKLEALVTKILNNKKRGLLT